MNHFGSFVRELREARGLTQRHLAERINLAQSHLSDIENGRRPPLCPCRMVRLSEVLKVPLDRVVIAASRQCQHSAESGTATGLVPGGER